MVEPVVAAGVLVCMSLMHASHACPCIGSYCMSLMHNISPHACRICSVCMSLVYAPCACPLCMSPWLQAVGADVRDTDTNTAAASAASAAAAECAEVSHGVQLQYLGRIPTAAVS